MTNVEATTSVSPPADVTARPLRAPRSDHEFITLLELYKENCTHGRHIESQRSAVSSMFLTAAGVLLSVVGALKLAPGTLPLAICVIGLAYFAKRFVKMYSLTYHETSRRRRHYRERMEEISGAEHCPPLISGVTLRHHWAGTFDLVLLIGTVVSLAVLIKTATTYQVCMLGNGQDSILLALLADCAPR